MPGRCVVSLYPETLHPGFRGKGIHLGPATGLLDANDIVTANQGRQVAELLVVLGETHPLLVVQLAPVLDTGIEEQKAIERRDLDFGSDGDRGSQEQEKQGYWELSQYGLAFAREVGAPQITESIESWQLVNFYEGHTGAAISPDHLRRVAPRRQYG